jgi:hypothetical protein
MEANPPEARFLERLKKIAILDVIHFEPLPFVSLSVLAVLLESTVGYRYVGSIERGQRNPTFGALQGIASVFGMKTWELLRTAKL